MLTGRESLIRLVGQRRRYLPNRQSLLSTPIEGSLVDDKDGGLEKSRGSFLDVSGSDWVNCPNCGLRVRGEDYVINSHLDTCLSKRSKRKMTQRTLVQFNFCSQLLVRSPSNEVEKLVQNPCEGYCDGAQNDSGLVDEKESGSVELGLSDEVVVEHVKNGVTEKLINEGGDEVKSLRNEVPKCDSYMNFNDIVGVTLETLIVGRKFSTEKELDVGAKISLLRDPNNPKDPNAIKVLLDDCGCCKVLGFLPRELAQHISPLIEKYAVTIEGRVTSVPKLATDVVPIEITCRQVVLHGNEDQNEIDVFTSLWNNALHVVKSPKTAKYQKNFCLFVEEVLRSNSHLFTADEKYFMESFTALSDDSQRLFVRLYARKGQWFRMSNILYPEVSDPQQATKGLSEIGYICSFENTNEIQDDDLKEIMNLLNVSELREIACMFKKNGIRGARKQDFIMHLFSSFQDGVCPFLSSAVLDKTGTCIKIKSKAKSLIWRAERLFFLNGEQDLSAFLLVDLGIVKYPTYRCITSEHIFSSRNDVLAYEEAIEVAQMIDESLDDNNTELVLKCITIANSRMTASSTKGSQSMDTFLSRFSASWVYSKVVSLGISFLEREQRYNDAVNLLKKLLNSFLCDGRRGHWTLRLSIDLEHIGYVNESLSVAEVGLQDPWVRAGARMALQRRVIRLGKPPRRWKVPSFSDSIKRKIKEVNIQGRPLNRETGMKSRFYGEDGEQCGVEQLALQYYADEGGGWQGVHTESGIWLTIFGLLMWEIMFADVPNVFRNRFQTAPLDLDTDSFYMVRKNLIETHLQKIYDGMGEEILITSWELHLGISCRGVNWDRHSLSELRAAVTCIGGPCLASLCRHLAQDYCSWSSGMPDLLLWRFHGDYRGEAKLVEVKGPRDRLSEQQRAWLLLLMDCGFDTEVCKVSPIPLST